MSCEHIRDRISPLLDRRLAYREREQVLAHVNSCRDCGAQLEALQGLRAALRRMDAPAIPPDVSARLRDIAADARIRHLMRTGFAGRVQHWITRAGLMFEDMMRPLALPFAGGMLSALVLFGLLVPSLSFQHNFTDDVPTAIFTYPDGKVVDWGPQYLPRVERANASVSSNDTVLDLTLDPLGRVRDWTVIRGTATPEIIDVILFSRFTPATNFGQPTWGKTSVVFSPVPASEPLPTRRIRS